MTAVRRPVTIPVNILTGFLGAGKTTLLNALVKEEGLSDAVVLINEFGEIGLDHLLVEGVQGDMLMLSSGCLCCSIRGELVSALEDLLRRLDNKRMRAFSRVVIETTGLADPVPILNTMMLHPYLSRRFSIDSVVTVVDAANGLSTLDTHVEARRQAAVADRLVLAKSDLVNPSVVAALAARLRDLNPTAVVVDGATSPDVDTLFNAGLFDPGSKIADVRRWLNAEAIQGDDHARISDGHAHEKNNSSGPAGHTHDTNRHNERIRAFCLTSATPLRASALDLFLQLLRAMDTATLLRLKGIVALVERPEEPLVLHGVQHMMHEPVRLGRWPTDDRSSRLVIIAENMSEAKVRELWAEFTNESSWDSPDLEALSANPLTPKLSGLLG